MSFRSFDFLCPECGYHEEHTFDLRGMTEDEKQATIDSGIKCPNCDHEKMDRVWLKAPSGKVADAAGDLAKMKKSFRERFVKNDLDGIKHTWGDKVVNDALVSGEVKRIEDAKND
jgi:DNA-directed RNA polymerase subunit M/transcription elongation factor TFIIS